MPTPFYHLSLAEEIITHPDLPEDLRKSTEKFMDETIMWLNRVMEVGRDEGEFSFTGEARAKALTILAAIQGARQLARIHGSDLLDDVVTQVRQDLGVST